MIGLKKILIKFFYLILNINDEKSYVKKLFLFNHLGKNTSDQNDLLIDIEYFLCKKNQEFNNFSLKEKFLFIEQNWNMVFDMKIKNLILYHEHWGSRF